MSDPLTSLVKKIDETVNAASGKYQGGRRLGAFVISGDAAGRADQLRGMAECESLQRVTLCIGAAPPRYEVNPAADVTVVIYTPGRPGQNTVTANFALRECDLDETKADEIVAALAKVLAK
jgi:hypothetical protein